LDADVLVVGAGPAGAIAALILARAGVRVRVIDRSTFPRDKLCGDSLNPGAMALLSRHGLAGVVEARGLPVEGMWLTGPGGIGVAGTYPRGLIGRSLRRSELDVLLISAAERAGAMVELGVRVRGPLTTGDGRPPRVSGVTVSSSSGAVRERRARVILAADGRRSTIATALGLVRQPRRPRRWALGAYYEGVDGLTNRGEMHVRSGRYLGVAPVPNGLTNVCLVVPEMRARAAMRAPAVAIDAAVTADDALRERFRGARRISEVRVLGPLAADAHVAGVPGLLLAGDAAGFIDPITGDGMRIAMRGAELAAAAAQLALAGAVDAHGELALERAREFSTKLRVNRLLRAVVARPATLIGASALARLAPSVFQELIAYSGDVGLTSSGPLAASAAAI
jgi:flavin-dependent dehydrogenase